MKNNKPWARRLGFVLAPAVLLGVTSQAQAVNFELAGFDGSFTQAVTMAPLRAALRDAARQALGAIAHDVLIVDITRQKA